jgi:hypothetical protein
VVVVVSHCHASMEWYEPMKTLPFEIDSNGVCHLVLIQMCS